MIRFGLCQCGCGEPTALATKTQTSVGAVKGEPARYVRGHNRRPAAPDWVREAGTGCWVWQRALDRHGYGRLNRGGEKSAHRWMYRQHRGPIPDGADVHHRCGNRACVNPDHLELLDHAEHARHHDTGRPGPRKTHCASGHLLAGDNLYITPHGNRRCRECRRAASRRHREAKAVAA